MRLQFIFSLSATETLLLVIVYFALIVWAFVKVIQNERGWALLGWGAFLWFVPLIGAISYWVKYYSEKSKLKALS